MTRASVYRWSLYFDSLNPIDPWMPQLTKVYFETSVPQFSYGEAILYEEFQETLNRAVLYLCVETLEPLTTG